MVEQNGKGHNVSAEFCLSLLQPKFRIFLFKSSIFSRDEKVFFGCGPM